MIAKGGYHNVAIINLEKIAMALEVDIRDLFKK